MTFCGPSPFALLNFCLLEQRAFFSGAQRGPQGCADFRPQASAGSKDGWPAAGKAGREGNVPPGPTPPHSTPCCFALRMHPESGHNKMQINLSSYFTVDNKIVTDNRLAKY